MARSTDRRLPALLLMAKLYASIRTQSLDVLVQSRTISACPAPPRRSTRYRAHGSLYPVEERDDIVHA
jgi:hypothetical protein